MQRYSYYAKTDAKLGEIHNSVLYIFAQILIYAGSISGIDVVITDRLNKKS